MIFLLRLTYSGLWACFTYLFSAGASFLPFPSCPKKQWKVNGLMMAFSNLIRVHPEGDTEFCRACPARLAASTTCCCVTFSFTLSIPVNTWWVKVCGSSASSIHDNSTYSRVFSIWDTRRITHSFFSRDHMMNNWIFSKLKHSFYASQYHFHAAF